MMHPAAAASSGPIAVECSHEHVAVQPSQHHGRGLFATRAFAPGEVILRERPLVALQSLDNRQYVPCCGGCFHFLGSARHHLMLLAEAMDRAALGSPEAAAAQAEEAALFPQASFSPLVPCAMNCGEMYCSPACRDAHWARGHRLLCVGPIREEEAGSHPLVLYKMHAVRTNEIFLLVADVVALVITRAEANGGDLQAALQPFRGFVQLPWWEVATNPDPGSDPAPFQAMLKALVHEASALLTRALQLPPSLAPLVSPAFLAAVIGMFEQNNVGIRLPSPLPSTLLPGLRRMLATGEGSATQQGLVGQVYLPLLHKVAEDWRAAQQEQEEEDEEEDDVEMEEEEEDSGGGCCADDHHQHNGQGCSSGTVSTAPPSTPEKGVALLDDCLAQSGVPTGSNGGPGDGGGLFSPLDGTALLSLICCMNHSCAPNCEVRWVGGLGGVPVLAELVALSPIPAGEELYQSYVKVEGTTVEARREALRDYGFWCRCPRCVAEEGQQR